MYSKNYVLSKKQMLSAHIMGLYLKPEDGEHIEYTPGQFMLLTLPCGVKRAYSIVSAPGAEFLEFGIKLVDGEFTSRLPVTDEGEKILVEGPLGPLMYEPLGEYVLIAGGVGITPMMSVLRARDGKECRKDVLFYSSRTRDGLIYFDELEKLEKRNECLQIVFTLTREAPKNWKYENGHVDAKMIKKYVKGFEKKRYFVCGPAKMVDGLKKVILEDLQIPNANCTFEGWGIP